MDWLEALNQHIDWINKTVTIPSASTPIQLQGHKFSENKCPQISAEELQHMCVQGEVDHLVYLCATPDQHKQAQQFADTSSVPVEIQHILEEFSDVFATPGPSTTQSLRPLDPTPSRGSTNQYPSVSALTRYQK